MSFCWDGSLTQIHPELPACDYTPGKSHTARAHLGRCWRVSQGTATAGPQQSRAPSKLSAQIWVPHTGFTGSTELQTSFSKLIAAFQTMTTSVQLAGLYSTTLQSDWEIQAHLLCWNKCWVISANTSIPFQYIENKIIPTAGIHVSSSNLDWTNITKTLLLNHREERMNTAALYLEGNKPQGGSVTSLCERTQSKLSLYRSLFQLHWYHY